jgi:hypothetical protein
MLSGRSVVVFDHFLSARHGNSVRNIPPIVLITPRMSAWRVSDCDSVCWRSGGVIGRHESRRARSARSGSMLAGT